MDFRSWQKEYGKTTWRRASSSVWYRASWNVCQNCSFMLWKMPMDRLQKSAPSWITVVRHLESSFAGFMTARSRSTCTCTSRQNPAKFVACSCETLDGFPCSFCCHCVWIRKLVAVRVVALDTSGPMATSCGDVLAAGVRKEGAAWGPSNSCRALLCASQRQRALPLVAVGALHGWTASLLNLPALEHHLC